MNDVSRQIEQTLHDPDMYVRHCRASEMLAGGTTIYVLNMFGEQGERTPSKRARDEWFAELQSLRTQNPGSAVVVAADVEPAQYRSVRASFGVNLVVFPDRLDAALGDAIVVTDSSGRYAGRLP